MIEPDFKPELLTTIWLTIHKNKCVYKNAYSIKTVYIIILKNKKQPCINQYGISQLIYDTHNHIQNVSDFRELPQVLFGVLSNGQFHITFLKIPKYLNSKKQLALKSIRHGSMELYIFFYNQGKNLKKIIINLLVFNLRVHYQQTFIKFFVSGQINLLLLETAFHFVSTVMLRQSSVTLL